MSRSNLPSSTISNPPMIVPHGTTSNGSSKFVFPKTRIRSSNSGISHLSYHQSNVELTLDWNFHFDICVCILSAWSTKCGDRGCTNRLCQLLQHHRQSWSSQVCSRVGRKIRHSCGSSNSIFALKLTVWIEKIYLFICEIFLLDN